MGKSVVKSLGSTQGGRPRLLILRGAEEPGIPGVAVKCVEIGRNTGGEGGALGLVLTLRRESVGSKRD